MNRPEPRPLPKPLRVLCLFVAALLVCSLGVIVANHQPSTAGDEAYTVISATGYGTVQHPCRTVEVVVGGQKPFWSLRNTQ